MDILLLGKNGQLGRELGGVLPLLGSLHAFGREEADLEDPGRLTALVEKIKPALIVNAAAHTAVDLAESEPERAFRVNAEAPGLLAGLAEKSGAWLVHYSTDYVFNGRKDGLWLEDDPCEPLNVYGKSKLAGEKAIQASGCRHLIFRASWVFALFGRNFPKTMLALAGREKTFPVVADQHGAPTSAAFLAAAAVLALRTVLAGRDDLSGLYHLTAGGSASWRSYAAHVVEKALALGWELKAGPEDITAGTSADSGRPAARPANSRLSTVKFQKAFGLVPPHWTYYVDRLIEDLDRLRRGGN